ncbi:MAG: pseudaminic acid cytidylyltransferase [Marinovum algicola]|jgi:pseudaminic acid cytidylyltransferase|uniref:N-acylneuraminate cytidylyltransferase n=2 Tax=Marinovum TaxID=367771 RepID=A0A975ZQU7_9RHOB|nr:MULTISPECIES: pseudaminic acid cytidylyltransferase [Marinovum]MDD9740440.1 pseudaminic acid cytidylyltransferase [Marinovum sp. SP66]SEK09273.1 N-acylneuraminate cytidylyltransferase [Marinovum algicola]
MQIALIPARGGSKRIPRKNIRPFAGRPMIGWPIAAARASGLFDHVIVSTDDEEIAEVARAQGAEVPFIRPDHLADDFTPAREAIVDAVETMEEIVGQKVERLCCIYATAAFVQAADLQQARRILDGVAEGGFVFAAASYPHPVHRAMTEGEAGIGMLFPDYAKTRTQDLPEAFHDAGMFYWGRRDAFVSRAPMFNPASRPHVMPRQRALDIDTPQDWDFAEALFELGLRTA